MDLVLLAASTLWTLVMTDKARSSAEVAAAYTEATIEINRSTAELERNLEAKIRRQNK